MINLYYPNILDQISEHYVSGRTESASFLIWYLENYYRLDSLEATDSVCDQKGDKGIDGIYLNEGMNTIDVFQTRIYQDPVTKVGDTALKEFYGSLSQFNNKESLQNLVDSAGKAQVSGLIKRLDILSKLDAYDVRGFFISNVDIDKNGKAFLKTNPIIQFIGKTTLENTYISDSRDLNTGSKAVFDISGFNFSKYIVDKKTVVVIAPIKVRELIGLQGIQDQSIFAFNVRGPLGKTQVNKDIEKSIKDKSLHKKFPLFHNGITIIADKVINTNGNVKIETYFVVNGCQSLTSFFENSEYITDDLRVLTKFVQVDVSSGLSDIITNFSNNQNGIKARDFKSNNPIQIRLQNEFKKLYPAEYFYEIKRGELPTAPDVITNEIAGIYLMSFDLKEPWNTHRKYQVFEDKYADLFGRPGVDASRILMLFLLDKIIQSKLSDINNKLFGKYALTRYTILYILRIIFDTDETGRELIISPQIFVRNPSDREHFIKSSSKLIDDIITDINQEVDELGEDFDYKSRLRDDSWVKTLQKNIVSTYLKIVKRGTITSFKEDWLKK